jgi:hypothetical protein
LPADCFSAQYEDGYGVCYGIQEDSLKFSITANTACKETSAEGMRKALADSLIDMQRVLLSRNLIYIGAAATGGKASGPTGQSGGTTAQSEDTASKL